MGVSYFHQPEEEEEDKELLDFIDKLAVVYDKYQNDGTWILNPASVSMLNEAAGIIKRSLAGQNVEIDVQPFGADSHIGTITITSKELIVFKNPRVVTTIGKRCIGIDFSSYANGETEVIFSFKTANKI